MKVTHLLLTCAYHFLSSGPRDHIIETLQVLQCKVCLKYFHGSLKQSCRLFCMPKHSVIVRALIETARGFFAGNPKQLLLLFFFSSTPYKVVQGLTPKTYCNFLLFRMNFGGFKEEIFFFLFMGHPSKTKSRSFSKRIDPPKTLIAQFM